MPGAGRIKNYIPIRSEIVVGPEHTFVTRVHAIRANEDGTCYARLVGDPPDAWRTYTISAGDYIFGEFAAVRPAAFGAGVLVGLVFRED